MQEDSHFNISFQPSRLTRRLACSPLHFDLQGVKGTSVENDIDVEQFKEYLPFATSPEALAENSRSTEEQMWALRLLDSHNTPTVTAILLLGKNPRAHFPCAYIQFVRYDGNSVTDNIASHKELKGTLPQQLRGLNDLLESNIKTGLDTSGARHIENLDYPYVALRELMHNAVVHRDYEDFSMPISINWFADWVEVISPGSVHGGLKKEDFGNPFIRARAYRNPTIGEGLKNLGFVQRFGRGILVAREALAKNGNPEPEFAAHDSYTYVKITRSAR